MARGDDTYKLPMRRWMTDLVVKGGIEGLEWFDQPKGLIKIPWSKMHHPGWESCNKVVTAWAEHQHRDEKKGAKSDFSTLKANFRNALRKSEDFEEDKVLSQLENQTGNFKVFRILTRSEVEAKKLERKQANADLARKRKKLANSSAGGKFVCNQLNYDDGQVKMVSDKDLNALVPSHNGLEYSPALSYGNSQSPTSNCISPMSYDSPASQNMAYQTHPNIVANDNFNYFGNSSTTIVPMQCTSDRSLDPVAESMQQHNIQCTQDVAPSVTVVTSPAQECHQLLQLLSMPTTDLHKCELTVRYNSGPVLTNELRETNQGYRIFYGDERDLKEVLECQKMLGPAAQDYQDYMGYQPIQLPNPKSEFKHLQEILNVTELGLTFRYDEATCCFYMRRLCQSQIFYLDPHVPIIQQHPVKIERKQEVCIFSYLKFLSTVRHAMFNDDPQQMVYPIIQFSIGSKSNLENPEPSQKGIKVKIIIHALKNFLEESTVTGELSFHLSTENEMDKLLKQWKKLKMH